jgi:hypothetical protein
LSERAAKAVMLAGESKAVQAADSTIPKAKVPDASKNKTVPAK